MPKVARIGLGIVVVALLASTLTTDSSSTGARVGAAMLAVAVAVAMALAATAYFLEDLAASNSGRIWLVVIPTVIIVVGVVTSMVIFLAAFVGDLTYVVGVRGYVRKPRATLSDDA